MEFKFTNKIAKTFLLPDVKKFLSIWKKHQYKYVDNITHNLKRNKLSFKLLNTNAGSAIVFKSKKLGLVFKINGTFSAPGTKYFKLTPKNAIPTVILNIRNDWIRIQPFVNTSDKKIFKVIEEINKRHHWKRGFHQRDVKNFGQDIKIGNLGIWNNKVVTIDW
jgi:hypothetical protein